MVGKTPKTAIEKAPDEQMKTNVLLGELQFAFTAFLMGQSLEGFIQWKALVNLLFACTEAYEQNYIKKYVSDECKYETSIVRPEEFQEMIEELFLLNGVFNIGDWIPWLNFLDLQGYVKQMKALKKKFDRFLDHVFNEHKKKMEGVKDFVPMDMVDILLRSWLMIQILMLSSLTIVLRHSPSQYGDWKHLSYYIAKSFIERIEPIGGEITVACESGIVTDAPKTAMEKALDEQMKSSKFLTSVDNSQSRRCYYTSIPRVIKQKGIHGQELTSLNIDKMGQSLEGFLQWKALVNLLFGCIEAPSRTRTQLFTKFIKVIYYQLKFGLEKDRIETSGAATGDFFSLMLDASSVDGHLLSWTRKLKELLENNLGWEFQLNSAVDGIYFEEDDEFAPVVEMLDGPSCN
nr:flavonoid 3'-monooxygenase [Quercus suber]